MKYRRFGMASDIWAPQSSTHPLTTTVVGSWPKPSWLSGNEHDITGWAVDREWQFRGEELRQRQDEATEWALREQEATGVHIVSDGEQRRDNYVYYLCRHLDGFDFEHRTRMARRSGAWEWPVPRITGPVVPRQTSLATDFKFVCDRTDRRIKMTMPGPMTIIDSVNDEYYGDEVALAMDLAKAIRQEVEALAAIGCEIIQFDESVFSRYPQRCLIMVCGLWRNASRAFLISQPWSTFAADIPLKATPSLARMVTISSLLCLPTLVLTRFQSREPTDSWT